jgi:hypothetical protein
MGSIHAVKMEYDLPDWEMGEAERPAAGGPSPPRYRRWLWQEINLGKRVRARRLLLAIGTLADAYLLGRLRGSALRRNTTCTPPSLQPTAKKRILIGFPQRNYLWPPTTHRCLPTTGHVIRL